MKLSIITTITRPDQRQDPWKEAITNYLDLADEVVVVCGAGLQDFTLINDNFKSPKLKIVELAWPNDGGWDELPKHYNFGLAAATGDWVINLDIDRFVHEDDFKELRQRLETMPLYAVATFSKISTYGHGTLMRKGEVTLAINKNKYPDVGFGKCLDEKTDLCVPILWDGNHDKYDVPTGFSISPELVGRTGVNVWNFDYTFKDEYVATECFLKMSLMHKRYYSDTKWGTTLETAKAKLKEMLLARQVEAVFPIYPGDLPKYIEPKYLEYQKEKFWYET